VIYNRSESDCCVDERLELVLGLTSVNVLEVCHRVLSLFDARHDVDYLLVDIDLAKVVIRQSLDGLRVYQIVNFHARCKLTIDTKEQ
jgi:hypothetical protein